MSNIFRNLACTIALAIFMSFSPDATAAEVGTESGWQLASIDTVEGNIFNSILVSFGSDLQCGSGFSGLRPSAYLLSSHAGTARDMMYKTLLTAFLAGREVSLRLVRYDVGSTQYCAIKRVRIK